MSAEHAQGDLIYKIKTFYDYAFDVIFHLAASLSSKAEVASEEAHRINVEGTMQLLLLAAYRSEKYRKSVKFLFPSSIAAYGMGNMEVKRSAERVKEDQHNTPHTMYGCNKLYCEKLGIYYSKFHAQRHLDEHPPHFLDFRAIRFPGLISAFTLPSGGTSDYGPEMLHAAAQGKPYACFVRDDTKISFMAMPDAIKSLLMLMDVPRENLSHQVYNIAAFALTAGEFRDRAVQAFPGAEITFEPNPRRQGIVAWTSSSVSNGQDFTFGGAMVFGLIRVSENEWYILLYDSGGSPNDKDFHDLGLLVTFTPRSVPEPGTLGLLGLGLLGMVPALRRRRLSRR